MGRHHRSFGNQVLLFSWLPIVLAAAGVAFQAWRFTGRGTEFVAVGKVLIGTSHDQLEGKIKAGAPGIAEVFGTQIELLESGELRRRALERVRSLNPGLREIDVEIRVTQTKGSSILNVAGVGSEGKYTRIFVSALLDEYVAFRRELVEKSLGSGMNKVIEEVLSREKRVKEARARWEDFNRQKNVPLLESEQRRLVAKVSELRGQMESLKQAQRADPGGSGESAAANINRVGPELEEAEKNLQETAHELAEVERLKREYERANEDYTDWKKTLERIDAAHVVSTDTTAILERPVVAVESEPDLVLPMAIAAIGGGMAGVILMLLLAAITSTGRSTMAIPPPPLP